MQIKGMLAAQRQAAQFEGLILRSIDRATMQEAHELRKEMVIGLRSQSPGGHAILPLSETTILLRGLPRSGGGSGGGKRGKLGVRITRTTKDKSGRLRRRGKFVSAKDAKAGIGIEITGLRRKKRPVRKQTGKGRKKTPKRGSDKALIDRGDLIGGINVRRVGFAHYTVGVHRGERGRQNGADLVNIAEIQEKGTKQYTVTVTPKMAKFSMFLLMMGILQAPWPVGTKLRRKIPARPFLGPAHESWEINAMERFSTRLDVFLMGKMA